MSAAGPAAKADQRPPPQLPLAAFWSVDLTGAASASPVRDGDKVFVALKSAHLTARAVADGRELWRITKNVTGPMAADGGLLFVAAGDAVEAVRGSDGASAWVVPRVTAVAPLVSRAGWVIAVTDTEIVAIHATDGRVVWRHPAAGGVRLPPAIDGDRLYAGADDGRVLALTLVSGAIAWERFLPGGISTISAYGGRVYAGAGNKQFYCLEGRAGKEQWQRRIGSIPTGRIAADDEHVYFTALDNVVYALDRSNGNQRWTSTLRRRPIAGVMVAGHVVFVPAVSSQLYMFYDRDGRPSGAIELPADTPRDTPPDVHDTPDGVHVFAVTGGLGEEWKLTYAAPADDSGMVPLAELTGMPGLPFLTDPRLEPIGRVLGELIMRDPDLRPVSEIGFPVLLHDPPLQPLRTIPGLQLRPLSPALPARRGG